MTMANNKYTSLLAKANEAIRRCHLYNDIKITGISVRLRRDNWASPISGTPEGKRLLITYIRVKPRTFWFGIVERDARISGHKIRKE